MFIFDLKTQAPRKILEAVLQETALIIFKKHRYFFGNNMSTLKNICQAEIRAYNSGQIFM